MKEKKRVLDLVEQGVISSEEALILLENIAAEKDEKQIKNVSEKINTTVQDKDAVIDLVQNIEDNQEEELVNQEEVEKVNQDKKQEDYERLEKILDHLATESSRASVELDEVNEKLSKTKTELKNVEEKLMALNTKEELGELSSEEKTLIDELTIKIKDLQETINIQKQKREVLEEELKSIRKERFSKNKSRVASKFDIPEDWKEQATDTMHQFGDKLNETGSNLGTFFKKTFSSIADAMNDNMEWKDVNFRVPGVASTKFEHEFNYPEAKATLIDIKVANGTIVLQKWDQSDVRIEGKLKIYGKVETDNPLEVFLERSQIDVDDDIISFQVPNKRIRADLTFYLPERIYDHVSIKLLNGSITINGLETKDVYVKSTNGAITFNQTSATMLEIEGVNGDIKVFDGEILDTVVETVNGNVTLNTTPQTISVSLINGDVKITTKEESLRKIEATSVNGNVKIAVPENLSVEGTAKTNLGSIHSKLTDYEIIKEKKERTNRFLEFRRINQENIASINASTTTGNIYLKDTSK